MLRIELFFILVCTLCLVIAGFQGMFVDTAYLRPAQFATIVLLLSSIALYVKLLSLQSNTVADIKQ
jgi:hypothetical protein